jgi:hypothetical protein
MWLACWPHYRPLHIGQIAGPLTPDFIANFTQRKHVAGLHALAGPIGLRGSRRGRHGTHGEGKQDGCNIAHG